MIQSGRLAATACAAGVLGLFGMADVALSYAPATHGANWCAEHGTLNYLPGFPQPGDVRFPKLPAPITI